MFNFFGLIWLLLLPYHPLLILGPAQSFLKPGPMWHAFYLPIVLLAVVALLRPSITLARPQWEWFPSLSQLLQTIFTLIILNFMLNTVAQTTNGEQHPFVVLVEAAKNSPQAIRVAAIVNVSILIGLASAWLGLAIALIVHAWQFLKYVRKQISVARPPTSLQVR